MFCTVVLQATNVSYSGGNHLSTGICLSFPLFISSGKVPLPSFGFLARGVYLVPPFSFLKRLRHCGTFKVFTPYPEGLRHFPCRQPEQAPTALAYEFARHEHYRHLSLCEHGLSSTI